MVEITCSQAGPGDDETCLVPTYPWTCLQRCDTQYIGGPSTRRAFWPKDGLMAMDETVPDWPIDIFQVRTRSTGNGPASGIRASPHTRVAISQAGLVGVFTVCTIASYAREDDQRYPHAWVED